MADIRASPASVPASSPVKVPKSIRQATEEILERIPEDKKIVVVAQALNAEGRTTVRGAIYYRLGGGFSFVGYAAHTLQPKGLTAGAELRWMK